MIVVDASVLAFAAVEVLSEMTITTVRTAQLLRRTWSLREDVSGYDAAYVAVAEAYSCTLVTGDIRLAKAVSALSVRAE